MRGVWAGVPRLVRDTGDRLVLMVLGNRGTDGVSAAGAADWKTPGPAGQVRQAAWRTEVMGGKRVNPKVGLAFRVSDACTVVPVHDDRGRLRLDIVTSGKVIVMDAPRFDVDGHVTVCQLCGNSLPCGCGGG